MSTLVMNRVSSHKATRNIFDAFHAKQNRFEKFWQAVHQARLADSSHYHKDRISAINKHFGWNITSLRDLTDAQIEKVTEAITQGQFTGTWKLKSEQPDFSDPAVRRHILELSDAL